MNNKQIQLFKKDVSLTILPFAGGRIAQLTVNKSNNILSADKSLWNYDFPNPVKDYTSYDFMPFKGHTTWLGPQSEWWLHQNVNLEKKAKKDVWPPDPFWEYANFTVLQQTDSSVTLLGEKSIYTGVQLKKKYTILSNNTVEIFVEATNIRETPVAWDLWLNTRLPENSNCFVPIADGGLQKIEPLPNDALMEHQIIDGFFNFQPAKPLNKVRQNSAKAFLTPSQPYIFAFNAGYLFVIEFERYDVKKVHPEHAMVEIFNAKTHQEGNGLLELEYHSPYQQILPNTSIVTTQKWHLVKYEGENIPSAQIAFINKWSNANA